ncbi:hypothetical protein F4776DRAFT_606650 [Hypoxylon sp. NC0597]|nr:hypothetical protein F4776DRAFT_606650 [Hypoxylon sp. NC0597]
MPCGALRIVLAMFTTRKCCQSGVLLSPSHLVSGSWYNPGYPGVVPGASAAGGFSAGTRKPQCQVVLIKHHADRNVPFDKITAIVAGGREVLCCVSI